MIPRSHQRAFARHMLKAAAAPPVRLRCLNSCKTSSLQRASTQRRSCCQVEKRLTATRYGCGFETHSWQNRKATSQQPSSKPQLRWLLQIRSPAAHYVGFSRKIPSPCQVFARSLRLESDEGKRASASPGLPCDVYWVIPHDSKLDCLCRPGMPRVNRNAPPLCVTGRELAQIYFLVRAVLTPASVSPSHRRRGSL